MFLSIVYLLHINTGEKKPYSNKKHHQKKERIVLLQTTCVRDLMDTVERFFRIFLVCCGFLLATGGALKSLLYR